MSTLTGGLFSAPSGKTGGIVFGKGRTRQGKVVSARAYSIPSNPNTIPQQTQRSKFSSAKNIVRFIGARIYQSAFNRSVSQLPGFQSMMSILLMSMNNEMILSAPPITSLGSLDALKSPVRVAPSGNSNIDVTWDSTVSLKGSATDKVTAFAIPCTDIKRGLYNPASVAFQTAIREAETISIAVPTPLINGDEFVVGIFAEGVGANAGIFSPCVWDIVDVTT